MKNQSNKFKFFKVKQEVFKGFCLLITTSYITALIVNSTHIFHYVRERLLKEEEMEKKIYALLN